MSGFGYYTYLDVSTPAKVLTNAQAYFETGIRIFDIIIEASSKGELKFRIVNYLSDPTTLTQVWWDAKVAAGDTVTEKMIVCVKKANSYYDYSTGTGILKTDGANYDPTADADSSSVCSQ